jgi:four helix bundle protein
MNQSPNNHKYDLEERTAKFGEDIVEFCNSLKLTTVSTPLISQLVRSGTSIGANYKEANNASSKKDFRNKIYICKKESEESKHWLRMLTKCYQEHSERIHNFWKEAQELTMIFQKIVNSINK